MTRSLKRYSSTVLWSPFPPFRPKDYQGCLYPCPDWSWSSIPTPPSKYCGLEITVLDVSTTDIGIHGSRKARLLSGRSSVTYSDLLTDVGRGA